MKYISEKNGIFVLNTKRTTYAFRVIKECGYLEHLYFGKRIHIDTDEGLGEPHAFAPGNTTCYERGLESFTLEDMCLEYSTLGKGDLREPMLEITFSDGSNTLDLRYADYELIDGVSAPKTLPGSYDDLGKAEQISVILKDVTSQVEVELFYTVYPECDVITRRVVVKNVGTECFKINRMLSNCIDFDKSGYKITSFTGAWAREMKRTDTELCAGKFVLSSITGTSSNRCNPFMMMSDANTDENHGDCYGFNLIYSGNHYEAFDVSSFNKTRVVQGINPETFEWMLDAGESLEAPEAIMSFADGGYNNLSQNMHAFVGEHIVRGKYKKAPRPVLLNSWEASYFKIDKSKLLKLAKAAKSVGIELFVMDDGWFGERNDEQHSLGDWQVNEKKLPGGVKALADKINAMGMDFGIWVEPEMVNVDSNLYKEHPEWVVEIPGRGHSEGRFQRILDLSQSEVQDFIIDAMTKVFSSANISYVKWDMNRNFSDYFSKALGPDRQKELAHRYEIGLYRVMKELTEKFPEILFEGCASGGNRFDLGILCYFPQIWASDDTDAIARAEIQTGYSYGYPQSTISCHVSGVPNHQTLRVTPLETRYNVASFGVLGYECNLCDMNDETLKKITSQIAEYKENRMLYQYGAFYRGRSFGEPAQTGSTLLADKGNLTEWTVVSEDKSKAIGMLMQKLVSPNAQHHTYFANGLDEEKFYHIFNVEHKVNIKDYGDLINTSTPVHIKQDSMIHNLAAKLVKLDGAVADYHMYGDALIHAGAKLPQAFSGTGISKDVRHFPDFASVKLFINEDACEVTPETTEEKQLDGVSL